MNNVKWYHKLMISYQAQLGFFGAAVIGMGLTAIAFDENDYDIEVYSGVCTPSMVTSDLNGEVFDHVMLSCIGEDDYPKDTLDVSTKHINLKRIVEYNLLGVDLPDIICKNYESKYFSRNSWSCDFESTETTDETTT